MATKASLLQRFRPTTIIATLAAGGIATGLVTRFAMQKNTLHLDATPGSQPPKKVFSGGPAFISLPLESGEMVNHNTRKLRFKLPDDNSVSGLPLTCKI